MIVISDTTALSNLFQIVYVGCQDSAHSGSNIPQNLQIKKCICSYTADLNAQKMNLHYISDHKGEVTGVFIPIDEWEPLRRKLDLPMADKESLQAPASGGIA